MRRRAFGLLLLVGCVAPTTDEVTGQSTRALRVKTSTFWTTRTIPTCVGVQEPALETGGYLENAPLAAANTWEVESAVVFAPCNTAVPHLNMWLVGRAPDAPESTTHPESAVGTEAWGVYPGVVMDGVPLTPAWSSGSVEFFVNTARAYGLALGFTPEDLRWDSPMQCGINYAVSGTSTFGNYDWASLTNRCRYNPLLSATDVDGLQRFYGPSQPIATGAFTGAPPFLFVRGTDNALWQNTWNGSSWAWINRGGILGGSPTVLELGGVPHVFVRDFAGALVDHFWNGSGWQWGTNHGHPGVGVMGTPSAVLDAFGNPHIVIRGLDHALYERFFDGTSWSWTKLGVGTVASDPELVLHAGVLRVFAKSTTMGDLVTGRKAGITWSAAPVAGAGIRSQPRAMVDGATTKVFFRSTSDSLVELDFPVAGAPARVEHGGGMRGTPSIQSPSSIFVRGTDDRLWERWWTGTAWQWTGHGGPAISASPTATQLDGTRRVFVRNTAGGVEENYLAGSTWLWGAHPGTSRLP